MRPYLTSTLVLLVASWTAPLGFTGPALQLQPIPGFGAHGDGSLRAGDRPYLTSDGNAWQRGMAYNPVTGHLLIVNRFPPGNETVNILSGTDGTDLGTLDMSSSVLSDSGSYYITPTRIPTDMYYKPPSIGGSPTWYTYGNPGYDKTDGRGDWTYIVWSVVQNGGPAYPGNVNSGGGLVRALGKRDAIFKRCDVSPLIGLSYGAGDVQNGTVTSIYGDTTAGTNSSPIYGWLVFSYQKTGQPIVPCVRRYTAPAMASTSLFRPVVVESARVKGPGNEQDRMKRMTANLLKPQISSSAREASQILSNWITSFRAEQDPGARMEILTEMSQLDDLMTLAAMLDLLPEETDSRVRQQIFLLVGFMRSSPTETGMVTDAALASYRSATDASERDCILEVISNLPAPESVACVHRLFGLTTRAPGERMSVARAALKLSPRIAIESGFQTEVIGWLKEIAAGSENEILRRQAVAALATLGPDHKKFLADLLTRESSPDLRRFIELASAEFPLE
jgi:hypothetical protein